MTRKLITGNNPIILYDDINTHISYFMGSAIHVSDTSINFMIRYGKGLVYACISQEKAKQLELLAMNRTDHINLKDFTVSIDYKDTTTGISALERADTIKALTLQDIKAADFKRPGHVFPLISNGKIGEKGTGIAEVAVYLSEVNANSAVAYVCEILNDKGEVANKFEVEELNKSFDLQVISFSDVVAYHHSQTSWLEIEDRKYLDRTRKIIEYTVKNQLHQEKFNIFIRPSENHFNNVIYYNKCLVGDLLGSDACGCTTHFKDYHQLLLNGEVDAIVYFDESKRSLDTEVEAVISQQTKQLIRKLYKLNQKEKAANF